MNAYYIRFFSLTPILSLAHLQIWLAERGYGVRPAGTNALDIFAAMNTIPLRVELTAAHEDLTQKEVMAFLEALKDLSDPGATTVLDTLARAQAVVALRVPENINQDLMADVLDGCAGLGQGLVQVDGEGFYADGVLILELD